MKPFRFSLQSLQVLREQKERDAQKRYADALRASEEAAGRLRAATEELSATWTTLCEEVAAGNPIAKIQRTRAWCSEVEARREKLATAFKLAQHAANDACLEMMVAICDRQTLERLHEKHRRTYDRDVQREEQKILDELGLRLNFNTPGLHAAGAK